MDSRLDSAGAAVAAAACVPCRNESGSSWGLTGPLARLGREFSSVDEPSVSSMAEPDQALPRYSRKLLSDALDARRPGRLCRIAFALSGGTDTLARPTVAAPVSGSLDRAFLLRVADAPLAVASCCHD